MTENRIIDCEAVITEVVKAAMSRTGDPRLKQVMALLVEHAHAFVREANLTDAELEAGLDFIGRIGQANSDDHNEVILASDVLGISTLVAYRNNPREQGQSANALLGPFWRDGSPECRCGDNIARSETPGLATFVQGQVRDVSGAKIAGATVDVWQASPVGLYENQDPHQDSMNLRGRFRTDVEGKYHFRTVRPAGYPVPTHGPIGELLRAQNRNPYRPAHIHFMVSAPGYKTLITQVFADNAERLHSDVVFGVTQPLIGHLEHHKTPMPEYPDAPAEYFTLAYDFVLDRGERTFPRPPIK
ncbi:catechol 1,2-dioxygenase [Oxalobacteraceae bacterium CAVE-383]|nr:catechol 1,2-dioxygenase [Oxalobacteraceae bacterium CAVE-383]